MYFGVQYFGQNFNMEPAQALPGAPIDESLGIPLELRDVVIAAYNVGPGGVTDGNNIKIPNWDYVNAVEKFQASCPCAAL
jgi:hypothetical protein